MPLFAQTLRSARPSAAFLSTLLLLAGFAGRAGAVPEVAVDVGHGLAEPGALSARGRPEFEFNLDFAGHLARELEARRLKVRRVNFDGMIGSLTARPKAAAGSDFFIAVHHDSIDEAFLLPWEWQGSPQTYTEVKRGYGIFVSANNPDLATSLRCATAIGRQLRRAGYVPTQWHARKHRPADAANGIWYYDRLVVLYRTTLPALLFEAGVIKHRDEELQLADPAAQQRMADVVATGLAGCLSVPPLVPATERLVPASAERQSAD